ncbi:MAG: CPBP family intramembrane metalloprotease [Gammaproteobacteria bacterium]|nr:CPBP family intramembrane metalloprotease [Gammaproteobacteria bacterium]
MLNHYRRPFLFYSLATVIPWLCWFTAGYISHRANIQPHDSAMILLLGLLGISSPALIAIGLMTSDAALARDILGRLLTLKYVRLRHWMIALFLTLASLLLAQAISLMFGYSADQFRLSGHFTFSFGVFPVWLLLIVAPLLEELGWHSYGTDCLRNRFNLLATSLIFGLFWGLWHIPLATIEGYYHSNVVATGPIHSANFLLSIFPFVLIMNWLYYKTGRNILITVVFHVCAGYFNEIFATHPDSKVIQTALLTLLAIGLVIKDKAFFLQPEPRHEKDAGQGPAAWQVS